MDSTNIIESTISTSIPYLKYFILFAIVVYVIIYILLNTKGNITSTSLLETLNDTVLPAFYLVSYAIGTILEKVTEFTSNALIVGIQVFNDAIHSFATIVKQISKNDNNTEYETKLDNSLVINKQLLLAPEVTEIIHSNPTLSPDEIHSLIKGKIPILSPEEIESIIQKQIPILSPEQILSIIKTQLPQLTNIDLAEIVPSMTTQQIETMTNMMEPERVSLLIPNMTPEQVYTMVQERFPTITDDEINTILPTLTPEQIQSIIQEKDPLLSPFDETPLNTPYAPYVENDLKYSIADSPFNFIQKETAYTNSFLPNFIGNEPKDDITSNSIQKSISSSKQQWCLIGGVEDARRCIQVDDSSQCLSNQLYPSESICRNGEQMVSFTVY